MKNSVVSISFEDEKLNAVKRYMKKKNTDLEEELSAQLEKLYQKYVPAGVQEYIAERDSDDVPIAVRKPKQNGGEQ
ncbi:MAG: DUF6103 family protein [Eubacteriales bacterium]|nr:DUF6103 family protein [Eubacteriales bacterium]